MENSGCWSAFCRWRTVGLMWVGGKRESGGGGGSWWRSGISKELERQGVEYRCPADKEPSGGWGARRQPHPQNSDQSGERKKGGEMEE